MIKENLKKARHHIVFLLALISGSVLIYFLNGIDLRTQRGYSSVAIEEIVPESSQFVFPQKRSLNEDELKWAKVAWRYFEFNYNETTGLVNSVDNYASTTLWDSGNYLMALIAAYRLDIIDERLFDRRLNKILDTLATLKLYKNRLPNKVYSVETLKMTDYNNQAVGGGIGWSVIDIGRVLSPLAYISRKYPHYNDKVQKILAKWDFQSMQKNGELVGAVKKENKTLLLQEGRLGYEQFSAKLFGLFGVDAFNSIRYDRFLDFEEIYGVEVPYDIRDLHKFGANNYVVMEPYMLDGLEFGWDSFSKEFSYRLYKVQKRRFEETAQLTAVSEDHIDQYPHFLYNSVYVNGDEWVSVDEHGTPYQDKRLLSTKASFAMYALYRTSYTQKLMDYIMKVQSERGWYSGIYEKSGQTSAIVTCNTNAIILESLLYIQEGPLLKIGQ